MCLGVPAKVLRVWSVGELRYAEVDLGGLSKEVILALDEPVNEGDYVIVHAGMGISKIKEEEVEETLKIWEDLYNQGLHIEQ
ncbi:MAG: hypothetical protein B7O98_00305 [Zestosphaera tikiterensis]|uniref:Hydrogenase assembly protein HypC n=1 Tax=Zestosphaera tikiterensis TaxID=1973259 RepID=A0A2R7Y8P5_9CREN|nr:MAG: hypothetical protein B7O98_00305 [Zestosphaera tikiterensis]